MWIKFLQDLSDHKKDQVVEYPDADPKAVNAAQTLVDLKVAEKTTAPAGVITAASAAAEGLTAMVKNAVVDAIGTLTKSGSGHSIIIHDRAEDIIIPKHVRKWGKLVAFKGPNRRDNEERAYKFGTFVAASLGIDWARKRCAELKIDLREVMAKTSTEFNNQSSGFLVPPDFENDLIDLREQYGVFRRNSKLVPMMSDTRSDPRRVAGLISYFVGENVAGTLSDKVWNRVKLTAKKLMCLSMYTNELAEDAIINIGDDLADEIAYAFSYKEDLCGFTGTGAGATYGGIIGLSQAFYNLATYNGSTTYSNVVGLKVQAATGGWTTMTLADFNYTLGLLPQYAYRSGNVKWYCSQTFWGGTMQRLATAAGGNRVADIVDGVPQYEFLGFPVEISQVMPTVTAVNQIACYFGNLRMASSMGDRRETTIAMSDSALNAFQQDAMVIRGTERFDITIHDIGDNSLNPQNTQIGAVAGPVVALQTASS